MPVRSRLRLVVGLVAALLASTAVAAEDWAQVDTLSIPSTDLDGTRRYTPIWIVPVKGRAYIDTGNATRGANAVRDPAVKLVIGEKEYTVREFVETDDARPGDADFRFGVRFPAGPGGVRSPASAQGRTP